MSERRLVALRRRVPAARRAEYDALWGRLQREATALAARAWRFQDVRDDARFIEFLEFRLPADPRAQPAAAAALHALEAAFPVDVEEWREA